MSKLTKEILDYIETVVGVARTAGIDNIIIEKDKVRAIDDDKTVVMFQDEDVPALPFGTIGLNRIGVFSSRYDITKAAKDFSVDATIDDSNTSEPSFVRSLLLKGKGIKIDYRCANPKNISAPKALSDTISHRVKMTGDAVQMLAKGQAAMGAEEVSFIGSDDGVVLEMSDVNSDVLSYKFADVVDLENGAKAPDFTHKYPIKTIVPLFKQNPDGYFYLTTRGMMKVTVNNINVFVLPRS
jgi:hypothetical protein